MFTIVKACTRYWLHRNKIIFTASVITAAASVFAGGGFPLSAVVYAVFIQICALRFLKCKNSVKGYDAAHTAEELNVSRGEYFKSYIAATTLQFAVYAVITPLCAFIGGTLGYSLPLLPSAIRSHETGYSVFFFYILGFCLGEVLLCVLTDFINSNGIIKRAALIISPVYLGVMLYAFYMLFIVLSEIPGNAVKVHKAADSAGAAAALILAAVYILAVHRTGKKFLKTDLVGTEIK